MVCLSGTKLFVPYVRTVNRVLQKEAIGAAQCSLVRKYTIGIACDVHACGCHSDTEGFIDLNRTKLPCPE